MSNRTNGHRLHYIPLPLPALHFTNRRSHVVGHDGAIYSYLVMPQRLPTPPRAPAADSHMSRDRYRGDADKLLPTTVAFLNELRNKHKLTNPLPKWY